ADNARRLLAAMLQGVQPKGGEGGGIRMVKNAENAALLVQPVLFEPAQRAFRWVKSLCHGRSHLHSLDSLGKPNFNAAYQFRRALSPHLQAFLHRIAELVRRGGAATPPGASPAR